MVEGIPRLRLRLAGREGALHVGRRLGGADGSCAGKVHALPRGTVPCRCPRGRLAGCRTGPSRAWRSCSLCRAERARSWRRTSWPPGSIWRSRPGNDAIASHSEVRKTAKLMGQLPGTDFVTSGYSVMPRKDNMFGGGNYDADDLDEWLTVQRDWQVDAGIEPIAEDEALRVRERGSASSAGRVRRPRLPRSVRCRSGRGHARLLERRPARPRPGRRCHCGGPRCSTSESRASTSPTPSTKPASRTSPPRSSVCSVSASAPTTSRPRP